MSPSTYRRAEEKRVESKLCNKEETGEMIGQWRESGQRTPVRPDSPDEFVMIEKVDYQIETKSQKAQRIELEFIKLLVSHLFILNIDVADS